MALPENNAFELDRMNSLAKKTSLGTSLYNKVHCQRFDVSYTDLLEAGDGVAALFGSVIPDNALIVRVYYDVTTTFAGDGDDSSLISMGLEDQDNDVKIAVAIKTAGDAWDAGIHEAIQVGTAATMIKLSADRQLAVTWDAAATDTTLEAGAMSVFVEYVLGV